MFTVPLRPNKRETLRYPIDSSRWKSVFKRQDRLVHSIDIHNVGIQNIRLSSVEAPSGSNYEELGPDGFYSYEENTDEFFCQRTVAANVPSVIVTVRWYTLEYIEAMIKRYGDIFEIGGS